jgi:pimeloyl-ACP methyl ester carboxylesterase
MASMRPPSNRLVLGESRAMLEPAKLAMNSFKLATQPRGDGRTVLVLPGLAASDRSTVPIRSYLRGLNYDARGWGLGQNDGDVRRFVIAMIKKVRKISEETGRPVPLIGWSLGGVISREVAREIPEHVEQVITFGSPVMGGPRSTRVAEAYIARGADVDAMARRQAEREARAIKVPVTAIYTKDDGVVSWKACIDRVNPNVDHVEVQSTHIGLGLHHAVFVEVAQRLHKARKRQTVRA